MSKNANAIQPDTARCTDDRGSDAQPQVDTYTRITDLITEEIENGRVPWRKTWGYLADGTCELPRNYLTNRPYTGINSMLLACTPFDRPYFMTFNQVKAKGGTIRKGAKGAIVVFWKILPKDEEVTFKSGEKKTKTVKIPLLKPYHVFNVADIEGIEFAMPERRTADQIAETEQIAACEAVVAGYPNPPKFSNRDSRRAFYSPTYDVVNMPRLAAFESPQAYFQVYFHELTHSTGHRDRLNRKELVETEGYGGANYSKEELTAELGACFLSAYCGLQFEQDKDMLHNTAGYLRGWLLSLRNDKTLFVRAAGQAQKATNYILGLTAEEADGEN